MLLRLAMYVFSALAALAQQSPAPARPLDAEFAAAERDPAQIVPLLFEVSAQIGKVDAATGHALAERLEPFAQRAFFSPEQIPGAERLGFTTHKIASGELPGTIAKRYRFGAGMFRYWNAGYDERRIAAGKDLKVLDLSKSSVQLIVDKERFRLSMWIQVPSSEWLLAMYVPVGLGAIDSPTPSGISAITKRVRNPPWTHPTTHVTYSHGDPENVLGGYWIALDSAPFNGRTGIGLHGYTGAATPDWIERGASNGCIRMLQPDIDRVFELALDGTRVVLTP